LLRIIVKDVVEEMMSNNKAVKRRKPAYTTAPRPTGPHDLDVDGLPDWSPPDANHPEGEMEHYEYIGPVVEKYLTEHSHRTPATHYAFESAINNFLQATGLHENRRLRAIDREACQKWKSVLLNQTTGRIRKPVTIQAKMKMFSHFTRWLVNQDYPGFDKDPMRGLLLNAKAVGNSKIPKEAFNEAELITILGRLRNRERVVRPEFYWLCLTLMCTGARLAEMLNLLTSNVKQVDGIWVFDVMTTIEGRVKNEESTRKVPLHSQLIAAGFLDFVAASTTTKLFPTLPPKGTISRWFGDLLKACKVKRPALSTHSLRHTMVVKLEKAKVHPSLADRLVGHAVGTSSVKRGYLKSLDYDVKELQEALEKVTFPNI
jgi:integrase